MYFDSAIVNNIVWIGSLFAVNLFVGFISWPITKLFFSKLSDKGYSISHVIGWFGLSYISFLLITLKLLPLSIFSLLLILLIWIGINFLIEYKYKVVDFKSLNIKQLVRIQGAFLVLFLFMYVVKSYQAEIYQIERFMDYGFIKALFNSYTLPLKDIWFAGSTLNYYYFSHYIGYVMLSFTGIPTEPGFYILTSWIFVMMGINMFRIGKDIGLMLSLNNTFFSTIAGIISLFWGIFGGVLHSAVWVYNTFKTPTDQILSGWYAEPTRIIDGTISEIPIYSYMVAELHPHMWGMLSSILVLSIIINFWLSKKYLFSFLEKDFWLLAIVLGIAFMINSWDVVSLGILSAVCLFGKYIIVKAGSETNSYKLKNLFRNIFADYKEFGLELISLMLLVLMAYGISMPWTLFFDAPVSGIGRVKEVSDFLQWISFWGQFVIFILLFIYATYSKKFFKNFGKNLLNANPGNILIYLIIFCVVFFWGVTEIIYMKDILLEGEWYRANTYFKLTTQLWMWLAAITGPMVIFTLKKVNGKFNSKLVFLILWIVFSISSIYPVKAIWQAALNDKEFRGIDKGLEFWEKKYPYDYEVYEFLEDIRKDLPQNDQMRVILEAEGDSYKDNNYFSVFLGWQSVVGWPVHEWTWRGSYDEVGDRRSEVREVYTGSTLETAEEILDKYGVDYIIVGQIEEEKYSGEINYEKLYKLGKVIFQNDEARIIEVTK